MRRSAQRLQPCKWPLILRFVITGSASELASRTICGTSEKMVSTGVVVRIAFGQARPANPQGAPLTACACALDRMGRIPIQGQPPFPLAVAAADFLQESADIPRTLARIEAPPPPPRIVLIGHEQVDLMATGFTSKNSRTLPRGLCRHNFLNR